MRRLAIPVLYVVIFVGIAFALRVTYNRMICGDCDRPQTNVLAQRAEDLRNVRVMATGDSRMAVGFDPREYPGSYNDGQFGANMAQVYYRLKNSLPLATQLDTVFLSIGPYSFVMGPDNPRGINTGAPLLISREDSAEYGQLTSNMQVESEDDDSEMPLMHQLLDFLFPYAGQSQTAWDRYRMPPVEDSYMGYIAREVASQTAPRTGKDRAEAIFRYVDGPSAIAQAYARKIVEICERKGIKLILVRLPLTPGYVAEMEKFVSRAQYEGWLDSMTAGTMSAVDYIDLHDHLYDRPGAFQDGDHLNASGARLVAQALRSEIRQDLVQTANRGTVGRAAVSRPSTHREP